MDKIKVEVDSKKPCEMNTMEFLETLGFHLIRKDDFMNEKNCFSGIVSISNKKVSIKFEK